MADFNSEDPLLNLTLETDDLGIWLIDDRPEGPQQLGHISWKTITLALTKLDEEETDDA